MYINVRYLYYHFVASISHGILFVSAVAMVLHIKDKKLKKKCTGSYVGIKCPTLCLIWQVQNKRGNASGVPFQSMPSKILLGVFWLCIEELFCTLNGCHNPIFVKVTAISSQIMLDCSVISELSHCKSLKDRHAKCPIFPLF
jgi:hypothetical protein